jgi:DNA-binding IclR family transcriptional regulator
MRRMRDVIPGRDRGPLLTLSRGLGILEVLSGATSDGMSHARLAELLQFQRSTLYRYLASLEELGFVEVLGEGRYRLGPRAAGLATAAARERAFRRLAKRAVEHTSSLVGEAVHATIFSDGHSLTVAAAASSSPVASRIGIGSRRPAHASASGRVFLALLPAEVVTPWIEAAERRDTAADMPLSDRLDRVRSSGLGMDESEFWPGVSCLATPVYDHSDEVVGSLSLAVTGHTARSRRLREMIGPLQRGARSLSTSLGYE